MAAQFIDILLIYILNSFLHTNLYRIQFLLRYKIFLLGKFCKYNFFFLLQVRSKNKYVL